MTSNIINIEDIEYSELTSSTETPSKLVFMLHGLGSDCNDLMDLAPYIQKEFSDYHFISLNGIEAYDMAPFGRQWFSLQNRDPHLITNLMQKNAPKIQDIINTFQAKFNLDNSDTILLGFSQGTMVASYLTLTQEKSFAAMIGFSGRLIAPNNVQNILTKICLIHGQEDDVVPVECSKEMQEYFSKESIENELFIAKNLQHSIDMTGIKFAINFLKEKI